MFRKKPLPLQRKFEICSCEVAEKLGYGVMVTLQILVLPFLVRVRVPQQEKRSIVDFNNWALFLLLGYWLKIFSHRKVKLVDEYLFEGIQIVLLVEESAHFEPKNIIYVITSDQYTIHCTARKDSGPEGFIIVFNYVDTQHYCQLNFGTNGNTQHAIEQISGDSRTQTTVRTGSVETGKWYDVKLTVAGDNVKAWLDNEIVFDIILKKTP